jgi:hypothetical protein
MYFADLELCHYHSGPFDASNWSVPLCAIGWLERPHSFHTGTVSSAVILKLKEMLEQMRSAYFHYAFRGLHDCSLCAGPTARLAESYLNLFVPGAGVIYIAPAGIVHYIETHSYLPPEAFLDAVLRCPDCTSAGYREFMTAVNHGQEIPLEIDKPFIPPRQPGR